MGLNAVVYYRIENVRVPEPYRSKIKLVDEVSGRLDFEDGWENPYCDGLLAIEVRIGNMAHVHALKQRIAELCEGKAPIVLGHVLSDAFGGSPPISRASIEALERELSLIDHAAQPEDDIVRDFLDKLRRLCAAAIEQGNAIILC
ncbi:MAG: hypothetical protein N3A38_13080 [Planctomycetota bacterium]|nr:hypothetical protein [Planctomycetota bacterium]